MRSKDSTIRCLMTLPGLDVTVAASVAAANGDIRRFSDPQRLVAYLGLNPSVWQSGEGRAYHGHITKQGRGRTRGMLVEAAWPPAHRVPCVPSASGSPRVVGSILRPSLPHGSLR